MNLDLKSFRSKSITGQSDLIFPDSPVPVQFEFDQGMVDEDTLPYAEIKSAFLKVIERDGAEALQYVSYRDSEAESGALVYRSRYEELFLGNIALREQLARWVERRQGIVGLGKDNFILLNGTSQVAALSATAFINPGDVVLIESMSLGVAEKAFQQRGAELQRVHIDRDGLVIESLEQQLKALKAAGSRMKLLYTISTFHMPTGAVLSEERRSRLIELAQEWQFVILEDSVYAEIRYDGAPASSLLGLDSSGLVIQAHGFAKILAPGIRLGWACGHREMIEALVAARSDFGVSQLMCRVMAELLSQGVLDEHIDKINAVYRRKRDFAAEALKKYCGKWVTFEIPRGGMYFWLRLRSDINPSMVQQQWSMSGVHVRPGQRFGDDGATYFRLAFCHAPLKELDEGIRTIGQALARAAD